MCMYIYIYIILNFFKGVKTINIVTFGDFVSGAGGLNETNYVARCCYSISGSYYL